VSVTDSQRTIPINTEEVEKQAKIIMEILNVKDFEVPPPPRRLTSTFPSPFQVYCTRFLLVFYTQLDIQFCSEAKIRTLNKDWRKKSASTDILSFPTNEVSSGVYGHRE